MFKPRQYQPTQFGTDVFPRTIQPPPRTNLRIEGSLPPGLSADQAGDQITSYYSTNIARFIDANRQGYGLAGSNQRRTQMTLPGLTVDYFNNQGTETLNMTAFPSAAPAAAFKSEQLSDINYDGYLAYVQFDGNFPNATHQILLNGVQIASFSATGQSGAVIFSFGKTALRVHSLSDAQNPNNPKNMVGKIVPARAVVKVHNNNVDTPIPEHADLPGYPIFNWWTVFNQTTETAYPNPPIPILATHSFPDLTKAKFFNPSGTNRFEVRYFNSVDVGVGWDYELLGEFYSRVSKRNVQKSWNLVSSTQDILINDKPLFWGIGQNVIEGLAVHGEHQGAILNLDLSAKADDPNALKVGDMPPWTFVNNL